MTNRGLYLSRISSTAIFTVAMSDARDHVFGVVNGFPMLGALVDGSRLRDLADTGDAYRLAGQDLQIKLRPLDITKPTTTVYKGRGEHWLVINGVYYHFKD